MEQSDRESYPSDENPYQCSRIDAFLFTHGLLYPSCTRFNALESCDFFETLHAEIVQLFSFALNMCGPGSIACKQSALAYHVCVHKCVRM